MTLKQHIRTMLLAYPEGLTIREICLRANSVDAPTRKALNTLDVAYISHWVKPRQGPMAAVWRAVEVPAHAPKPMITDEHRAALAEAKRQYNRAYHAEGRRPDRRKSVREVLAPPEARKVSAPQGLTTIRGPWPT